MLQVHRASRGDWLIDGLAALLATPLGADPFTSEVVAVPTRGIERWLTQRLSAVLGAADGRADGVCANVRFPFPGSLVGAATTAATGVEPDADPWLPERAVWPLLEVVDAHLPDPWLEILAAHLGAAGEEPDAARQSRRFSTVRHLADLFDRYGVHRPAMVRSWADGHDTDGLGAPLRADMVWQAQLWRGLRDHLGVASPAERLDEACRRLGEEPGLADLPERLSLFGLTRLPASYLAVLIALGAFRDVHLWLLHPSPALWSALSGLVDEGGSPRRLHDATAGQVHNPLLATWGRDAREMQVVLARGGAAAGEALPEGDRRDTLLGRVQADVRADRAPPAAGPFPPSSDPRPVLAGDDRSLQVHACHGRARQVEVLRDVLLHLLEDDPTLQPRDVVVMCPDIDSFAPLIQATFGPGQLSGGGELHVRLADRSIRQTNPVLGATSQLLELAAGRVTVSDVLDLMGTSPLRRRFHLDDDDLARVDDWVRAAGVRWGLDAAGRRPYKLDHMEAGTWKAGLDRLLLGVAMSEDDLRLVGGVLPFDDVDSGDVDLVGRLAELTDRLEVALRSFEGEHPLQEWVANIAGAAEALMAASSADAWQLSQLRAMLEAITAEAGGGRGVGGPTGMVLTLSEVRSLLADRLRGRPTRANFRTGHLTMCSLVPMRSVPHRVVCLLGLDDGTFPRRWPPDGDDLLQRDPHIGDRDARSEERQLLLDALLAAEHHLVITYCGRDERTNATRPPAVPVGELLDVVDRTVRTEDGTRPRDRVVVHHPLQPWDVRNFEPGALVAERSWSFDRVALAGAEASRRPRSTSPPFGGAALPPAPSAAVELDDLVRFVQHPVRAFLRQRLDISVPGDWPTPGDVLPIELDNLERWQVGDRLLEARLGGAGDRTCREAEAARGGLPPGALGRAELDGLLPGVDALVAAAGEGARSSIDITVDLGGRTLVGTVTDVFGREARTVTYSKLGVKPRLAAWVRLLALNAARPEEPWWARSIGRGKGSRAASATVGPLGPDAAGRHAEAARQLGILVDLYDRGMRAPLPLSCAAAAAWVDARRNGKEPVLPAQRSWESGRYRGDDADPAHRLAFGAMLSFAALLEARPEADETGPGWADDEPTRFGRLAHRLWGGLLACEELRS